MSDAQSTAKAGKARNYPPLLLAGLMMLGLLAVMPSALNLPQTNPSQTLEYAPVPPEEDSDEPPPAGNFSSLGLGSSSALAGEAAGADGGGFEVPEGRAVKAPTTKRCVGDPPRQTEDPSSPPCVATFTGDNGGATYQGVTGNEIRVILYHEGGFTRPTSRGTESSPQNKCIDLSDPPREDDDVQVRVDRALMRYFNERYQTYGRFVRGILCFSGSMTVEGRKSEASDHIRRFKPFAFNNFATGTNRDAYNDVMTRRGVMSYAAVPFVDASYFRDRAPLAWNFLPSIEQYADQYADFVCTKIVPHPVSFSGNPTDAGKPRKLGLLYTDNSGFPNYQRFAVQVRDRVKKCGGQFVAEARYPFILTTGAVSGSRPNYGQENMARFQEAGVTTVIWPGGWETDHTKAAAAIGYRPEWVMAGDDQIEGYDIGQFQDQSVWQHAWVLTNVVREGRFEETGCYAALSEAEPGFSVQDAQFACPIGKLYESLRQLFIGIQVAGPRLSPASVDKGYHAIPAVRSPDPKVAACFYNPGDYTCVKDTQAMWWDPSGVSRNNRQGCYKMAQGGRRYLTGTWPEGDLLNIQNRSADICNGYAASIFGA